LSIKSRFFKQIFLVLTCVLALSSSAMAAFIFEDGTSNKTKAPRGATDVNMISFTLSSTDSDDGDDFDTIRLSNASDVKFGPNENNITSVRLYLDIAGNGIIEDEDTIIDLVGTTANDPFTASHLQFFDLDIANDINITPSDSYFIIAIDVGTEVTLGNTTELGINVINRQQGNELDLSAESSAINESVTITGVDFLTVTDIAPDVAIPGQKDIPMLHFQIRIVGEKISDDGAPDLELTIENSFDNFILSESGEGIEAVKLYKTSDFGSLPVFNADDDIFDLVSSTTSFGDSGTLILTDIFDSGFDELGNGVTVNFFLTYDLTDEMEISENTQIGAQIHTFSAFGDESDGPNKINWPLESSDRQDEIEVDIAGLTLTEISKYVPSNSIIGTSLSTSIMRFRLRSNHTTIDVNRINILNPGTTPFVTEGTLDAGGVSKVELYLDTVQDNAFSDSDTLIGTVTLAETNGITGLVNQSSSTVIPIVDSRTNQPIQILAFDDSNTVDYPENNEQVIFVSYTFSPTITETEDASGNFTSIAIAQLGTILGTANYFVNDVATTNAVNLSIFNNDSPASADPEAEIDVAETTLTLTSVTAIPDPDADFAIEGEIKVPMLKLEITNSEQEEIASTSFTIKNSKGTFSKVNQGVTKIWIYSDDGTTDGTFDDEDTFLSSTTAFDSTSIATLTGVSIPPNDSTFFVLYDIGRDAFDVSQNIRAQISDITADSGQTIILGAILPGPSEAASVPILASRLSDVDPLELPTVTLRAPITDTPESETFVLNIHVFNGTSTDLVIKKISPKFYLSSLSGTDISYEFDLDYLTTGTSLTPTIPNAGEIDISYEAIHARAISDGVVYIDLRIEYESPNGGTVVVERYLSQDQWESGAAIARTLSISALDTVSYTSFPAYISSVQLLRGGSTVDFKNTDAISKDDIMFINFVDADVIDTSSIALSLNGVDLVRSESEIDGIASYSYDESLGQIKIPFLGDVDGEIELTLSDGTNEFAPALIVFELNTAIKLSRPLFYPNPYILDEGNLLLGFNLTQPGDVSLYFYNQVGSMVHKDDYTFSDTGYNTIEFNSFSDFLRPGIYVVMLVSVDEDGNREISHVKLAVR
jgi:hypothetical protein